MPVTANDHFANLRCALPFFDQLIDKEPLLETERSAGAMIGCKTIEQAAMAESVITIAVTWLLGEDFPISPCEIVCPGNDRIIELSRIKHRRQRIGHGRTGKKCGDSRCWRRRCIVMAVRCGFRLICWCCAGLASGYNDYCEQKIKRMTFLHSFFHILLSQLSSPSYSKGAWQHCNIIDGSING